MSGCLLDVRQFPPEGGISTIAQLLTLVRMNFPTENRGISDAVVLCFLIAANHHRKVGFLLDVRQFPTEGGISTIAQLLTLVRITSSTGRWDFGCSCALFLHCSKPPPEGGVSS